MGDCWYIVEVVTGLCCGNGIHRYTICQYDIMVDRDSEREGLACILWFTVSDCSVV